MTPRNLASRRARSACERGSVTLWVLGLCVIVLFIGGLSFDLWNALSQRRALAGLADNAALAAATALEEEALRADGTIRLDPALARDRALGTLTSAGDPVTLTAPPQIDVDHLAGEVTVALQGEVPLTLTRVLLTGPGHLRISVQATAGALTTAG